MKIKLFFVLVVSLFAEESINPLGYNYTVASLMEELLNIEECFDMMDYRITSVYLNLSAYEVHYCKKSVE